MFNQNVNAATTLDSPPSVAEDALAREVAAEPTPPYSVVFRSAYAGQEASALTWVVEVWAESWQAAVTTARCAEVIGRPMTFELIGVVVNGSRR